MTKGGKNKMKRRIISLLVSLVLILSMVPMTAMAATPPDPLITNVAATITAEGKLAITFDADAAATVDSVAVTVDSVAVSGVTGTGTTSWTSDAAVTTGDYTLTINASQGTGLETYAGTYTADITVAITTAAAPASVEISAQSAGEVVESVAAALNAGRLQLTVTLVDEAVIEDAGAVKLAADGTVSGSFDGNVWIGDNADFHTYNSTYPLSFSEDSYYSATLKITPAVAAVGTATPSTGTWAVTQEPITELTLEGLGLDRVGDDLVFNGIPTNPAGTKYKIEVGSNTHTTEDLTDWDFDISGKDIGDKITVKVTASHTDTAITNNPVSTTLDEYIVTLADYIAMNMNELGEANVLKVVTDSGVNSYSFVNPNYFDESGGYYFFNDDVTTVKIKTVLHYHVSSATVDNGSTEYKGTASGVATYDIAFPTPSATPVNNNPYTTLTIKTSYTTIGETAPTHYYTIKAYAGTGGTITPSGTVSVPNGGNQSFVIVPNSGYEVESVVVDGVNRGALNAFTFTDVDADHSIIASFKKVSGTVTPTVPGTTLPPIVTPPTTIPATGATTMVLPGVALLLAGIALLPKRRSK